MELVQELFLTALMALVFSFFVAKLVSVAVAANGDHVESNEKGDNENFVKLGGGLRVEGIKGKKRVRFTFEKVDQVRGGDGSVGELEESGDGSFGNLESCLEVKREVEIVGAGNIVDTGFDQLIVDEKNGNKEVDDEKTVGLDSGDGIGGQSGLVRVLEELIVEERGRSKMNEGNSVNTALDELIVAQKNENEEAGDDGVVEELVEEKSESKVMEGNIMNVVFREKNENEEAVDEKIVSSVGDQIAQVRVLKELDAQDRIETGVEEEKRARTTFDELVVEEKKIENEGAGNEMIVILASEGGVGDESAEVRVLEVSEDQGTGIGGELDKEKKGGEGLVSDEDDDWEGIERSDLEKVFATAANYVDYLGKDDRSLNLGSDVQMQLYGLHKVAMEGPCYEAQPMALKVSARAKWNAWQRLGNMSPEVAMEQYVSLLSDKDPGWMQALHAVDGKSNSSGVVQPGVLETNLSTILDKQTNSMVMNLEQKFGKDGRDLTGAQTLQMWINNDKQTSPAA